MRIIGISGSLRKGSYNSAVLRAAASLGSADCELRIESIADIPLYNGDDEARSGIPAAVTRLKDAIASSDGFLIVTPEYNNSIPGVTKNAIDWLSRPGSDIPRVFKGRAAAIAGASPGAFGTILSQNAWLPVFRTLGVDLWLGGRLLVSRVSSAIDANGEIGDAAVRENIKKFMHGFAEYVRSRRQANL
jgi:chromate reductase, NAD(P)H dehydrogenase (quinone)